MSSFRFVHDSVLVAWKSSGHVVSGLGASLMLKALKEQAGPSTKLKCFVTYFHSHTNKIKWRTLKWGKWHVYPKLRMRPLAHFFVNTAHDILNRTKWCQKNVNFTIEVIMFCQQPSLPYRLIHVQLFYTVTLSIQSLSFSGAIVIVRCMYYEMYSFKSWELFISMLKHKHEEHIHQYFCSTCNIVF